MSPVLAKWLALLLPLLSLLFLFCFYRSGGKTGRSLALLGMLGSLFGTVAAVVTLELGSLANLLLMLWTVGHFWLMGKFDH